MANITLQEMYDEWKKAANGVGTPSDSAQSDPSQAATIIAALKGQLERLGDLLEQMQGNGTGAMPVQLTGRNAILLKEINSNHLITVAQRFYGEVDGATETGATTLDVSGYDEKMIVIQNGYDQAITIRCYAYTQGGASGQTEMASGARFISGESLAAGATKSFTFNDYPRLKSPIPGMILVALRGGTPPSSGSMKAWIFGSPR